MLEIGMKDLMNEFQVHHPGVEVLFEREIHTALNFK